ncbi:MAG: bacillithiol biosynthesis cysteine-adding enzyme BshC [Pyrinomonadaceae bacterium]
MNSESACVSEKKSFCVETIPFEQIPNQSRLFLDFQADSPTVRKFYPQKLSEGFIKEVLANYKTDRDALCDALEESNKNFGVSEKTLENINLLRENDCVAIVTGQQTGLFSGALYTIYKAFSAIRLAEDLRKQNVKAVPVFWIAGEDHDFDEVKKTFVINRAGNLTEIENTPRELKENSPVGFVRLDETIEETRGALFDDLRQTEFTDELKIFLRETYKTGETFSTAFAKFLTKIFGEYGLIIFAPLDEKLKKLSAPIFSEAVKKSDEIHVALLDRTRHLEAENYHAQVLVEKDFFPFFLIEENERFALKKKENGKYQAKGTKLEFSLEDLIKIAEREPQKLSPNALMRPVAQDYLLPTAIYFGGAAEIAYFAQNAEIYKILNRPATPIKHRASLTIIEPKNRRTLEKYHLKFSDLFNGREEIFARVVNEFLASGAARKFTEVEENINSQLNRLDKILSEIEPTLSTNLNTRRRKIIYHVNALMKKFQRVEMRKNDDTRRRLEFLFTSLLPHKALQERSLNVTYFLNLYGENFINWIYDAVDTDEKEHRIMYL